MVSSTDMAKFDEFKTSITKKYFEDLGMPALEEAPLLFTSFMQVCKQQAFGPNQSSEHPWSQDSVVDQVVAPALLQIPTSERWQ